MSEGPARAFPCPFWPLLHPWSLSALLHAVIAPSELLPPPSSSSVQSFLRGRLSHKPSSPLLVGSSSSLLGLLRLLRLPRLPCRRCSLDKVRPLDAGDSVGPNPRPLEDEAGEEGSGGNALAPNVAGESGLLSKSKDDLEGAVNSDGFFSGSLPFFDLMVRVAL